MPEPASPDVFATISPTSHPLVARYAITLVAGAKVTVDFGLTTMYGRSTQPVPAPRGGGPVSILIAGMKASTTYHVRARIQLPDGKWLTTPDQTFPTGALPPIALPTLQATTTPGQTPGRGVELVNVIDPRGISVVSDLDGNILWYYDNTADSSWIGYAFPIKPLKNGNMLASITNLYSNGVPQLSSRHQNWLMKLDYRGGAGSGAILWRLGYQGDFNLVGNATQPTDWFFAQHYPNLLSASGNRITSLSVFDNGNDRCYTTPTGCPATGLSSPPPFSRGVIFQIDEAALTAELAWQYPLNFYSYWGGNVMLFEDGHIEIAASEPVPIGTTPPSTDVPSQVVELANVGASPTIVWKMTVVQGGTYRSYRIGSLYPGVTWG